jgi:hypothetical protein
VIAPGSVTGTREIRVILYAKFILQYLSEPELHRRIRRGLLKVEQLHTLARGVFYGRHLAEGVQKRRIDRRITVQHNPFGLVRLRWRWQNRFNFANQLPPLGLFAAEDLLDLLNMRAHCIRECRIFHRRLQFR